MIIPVSSVEGVIIIYVSVKDVFQWEMWLFFMFQWKMNRKYTLEEPENVLYHRQSPSASTPKQNSSVENGAVSSTQSK